MITTEHIQFNWLPTQDIHILRAADIFTEEELWDLIDQYVNLSALPSSPSLIKLVHR
jgi:hypothetical protein